MQGIASLILVGLVLLVVGVFVWWAVSDIARNFWEILAFIGMWGSIIGVLITIGMLVAYANGENNPELNRAFVIVLVGTICSFVLFGMADKKRSR